MQSMERNKENQKNTIIRLWHISSYSRHEEPSSGWSMVKILCLITTMAWWRIKFLWSIPVQLIRHSSYLSGPSTDHDFTDVFLSLSVISGSSHRGGVAGQAPGQAPQSPADVTHLALPDIGVEDVLELQLQQLTVAQFTVATMEHAIPLLKTGRNDWRLLMKLSMGGKGF